ncbi:MAG: helix-turn-helix transcriptional regulator [Clostridia bacterium]|nr:helix-turn-helix transcriptional regulator [Clostridia bacterium]
MALNSDNINYIVKTNVQELLKAKNLKQADLGHILGISAKSTISNYLNVCHPSMFSIEDLNTIKKKFNVSLDDLCSSTFDPKKVQIVDDFFPQQEFKKFFGVYHLYYLSTNRTSLTRFQEDPKISYGVLAILNETPNNNPRGPYKCYACFSLNEEIEEHIYARATDAFNCGNHEEVKKLFLDSERYYEGNFSLVQKDKFFSIELTGYFAPKESNPSRIDSISIIDKVLMMGINPDNSGARSYIGGGAICSSISRGYGKTPCSQLLLLSRDDSINILDSRKVVSLLSNPARIEASDYAAEAITQRASNLFNSQNYTWDDKVDLLRNTALRAVKSAVSTSSMQILSLIEERDQEFYTLFKKQQD